MSKSFLTLQLLILISFAAMSQSTPLRTWIDSQANYTDSAGNVVTIHNSLPKGGGRYTDSNGKVYSYVIFWTKVINESTAPLNLALNFSSQPYEIFSSANSHIRIFLPTDPMTVEKIQLGDYGLDLNSFLDFGFNQPVVMQKVIAPKGEHNYYTAILFSEVRGTTRTALVLRGPELFFCISIAPEVDKEMIPCGRLVFRN